MIKLPFRKLKLGPHRWDIKLVDLDEEDTRSARYKREMANNLAKLGKHPFFFGETNFEDTEIKINKNVNAQVLDEVLLHEILHVGIDECELRPQIKSAHEEQVVQAMAAFLLQVFRDNPKLKDLLFKV